MALNRSVGATGGVARKVGGNASSGKASGIPSATKILRSSDHSIESSQKLIASQLADGKATTSTTSPKPRSSAREKGAIPGRTVPSSSSGGTGVNNNVKISAKSTTSSPLSALGTGGGNGPGRLPTKVAVKDRSGRSSPKLNGLPDLGGVATTELHSKPDAMPHAAQASSPPQSNATPALRVDKSGTRPGGPAAQTAQTKVGLPVASANKRSSIGSLSGKPGTPASVTKGKSPPMSSAVSSETSSKTELPKLRKATGIAKLQSHPSSSTRSLAGTTTRPRGLPGPASVANVRTSVGMKTISGTDISVNANAGIVRKDVRIKTGQPVEKVDNAVGTSALLNHKNLGVIPDKHKLSVPSSQCTNITENQTPKAPVHASQDCISKTFEEVVEDVSECEYFSETRSTVSENLSDFAEGGLNLDLTDCINSLQPANRSDMGQDTDGNITSVGTSLDDIFASCEDIHELGEDTMIEDGSSKTSDHTASPVCEECCKPELVGESFPVQSSDELLLSRVADAIDDRDLQVLEGRSRQCDLRIVEDGEETMNYSIDSSVVCERSLAADIPETSFDGIMNGSNLTVCHETDFVQKRATSGKVRQDKSEAILSDSAYQSSLKEPDINETMSQCALPGYIDERISEAEVEDENQRLQGDEKTVSENLNKFAENQNYRNDNFRTYVTMMHDVDEELTIIEEEMPGDFDIIVDDGAAIVDAERAIADMTTSAYARKPGEEDSCAFEVTTENATMPGANRKKGIEADANGQEVRNNDDDDDATDAKTESKHRGCGSNGFGADGVTDSDGDDSSGPPRAGAVPGKARTPTEASAAAAEVEQVKTCKNNDDSIRSFLGDSCETLKCEYESDVDPDSTKDSDGGSAAGSRGASCCCRNEVCGCSMMNGCTDITDKNSIHIYKNNSGAWSDDGNEETNNPTQIKIGEKRRGLGERIVNNSSCGKSSVRVGEAGCLSNGVVAENEILSGKGSGQSGVERRPPANNKCQDVDRSGGGGLVSFGRHFTLQKNYSHQDECDTRHALNNSARDNDASKQDGSTCRGKNIGLPDGAPGQLSSSFINEFSAWLATDSVTGSRASSSSSFDPGVSQLTRNADADFSSASQLLNGSSVVAMDTADDVKVVLSDDHDDLKFVDEDAEEEFDDDGGKSSIRENLGAASYKAEDGSFFNNSVHQQETVGDRMGSTPQTFDADLTNNATGLPGRHCSTEVAMPQQLLPANVEGINVDQLGSKFVEMAGSAAASSLNLPSNHATPLKSNNNISKTRNENLLQNQKTDDCLAEVKVFQNRDVSVFNIANPSSLTDRVATWMQNEGDPHPDKLVGQSEEGASSTVGGANKLREPLSRPSSSRISLPTSLSHANLMMSKLGKGVDSSIHRGPSPLSVLTDRPVNTENSKDGGSSQNLPTVQSDIPLLSVRRFRPITVQDYFTTVSSSNSLNSIGHETSEKVTSDGKLTKDANHNVVMTTTMTSPSVSDRELRPPTSEIAGFLSPRYVPSRPLSQICSRTMGNSLRRNMIGCDDGDSTSLTSVESLPTVDSSGNAPAKLNVLAQIRFARSCSRIGLRSPMPSSEGFPERNGGYSSSPRLPVAGSLPSFDLHHCSSGGTLTPQTSFSGYSRTDSSRQSECSTPVVGDCPSPTCATPTLSSGYDASCGSLVKSRNSISRLSRHQALDEEHHGSFVSLASVSSSVFSTSTEEKQGIELRKLKHELEAAKETIVSLKTQLNVNALMSRTYEQNIEGLTQRLKQLTTIIDQKESELCDLRSALKNSASNDGGGGGAGGGSGGGGGLHTIPDCVSVGSSFHRRSSNSSSLPHDARSAGLKYLPVLTRHISCESVNSLNSQSSSCSMGSQQSASLFSEKKKKKKNWIRSSFSKAFSRKKNKPGSAGEPDSLSLQSDTSNNEPLVIDSQTNTPLKNSPPEGSQAFPDGDEGELEKRLHEADMELTELRLEQLASIQNIDHLQEKINLLEQQVATLKAENKSLQRLLLHQGTSPSTPATSLALQKRVPDLVRQGSLLRSSSPGTPLPSSYSIDGLSKLTVATPHEMSSPKLLQRFSLVDAMASDASYEQLRRICVYVLEHGCELHSRKGTGESDEETNNKTSRQIGVLMLSEQASWLELDLQIGNLFVEHIHHLDPETGLGLDVKSIASYRLGSQERIPNSKVPDSLPSKNLPTSNACIKIRLQDWQEDSVDFLAFDTLVPKPFLHQYVSLLLENRRLLFCGPNLSGKTFLAKKLARHLVLRKDKKLSSISIAQFTVDSKSSKELQQYLSNIVSHCEQASDRLPSVIVIDNLHLADNLSKAFSGFFSLDSQLCPYLIGTMTQSRAASITCLQFHQNFRWVLFGQTDEPMKSFLARYLHRQSAEKQFRRCSGSEDGDCGLLRVVDWMPKVWHHVNRFVASICSPDKCIGPGIFLPCPMDVEKARAWFVDLWNYSIGPYLLQLIKDSSTQVGFSRSSCEDPTDWVLETSPWENSKGKGPESSCLPLLRLFPYQDPSSIQEQNQVATPGAKPFSPNLSCRSDPLLDMLLHLQVATCYADSVSTSSSNMPSRSFSGLSAASKISAASSSLHSAAL